jgi:hypothetical protein
MKYVKLMPNSEKLISKTLKKNFNYWFERRLIPIGTVQPHHYYESADEIPLKDIVTVPFDDISVAGAERNPLNVLILGASGDFKSGIMKMIWYVLQKCGYFCMYFDPKSTDSGRARIAWRTQPSRPAPFLKEEGIPLKHYVPQFARTVEFTPFEHHFRKYAIPLDKLDEIERWIGLNMTAQGANLIAQTIRKWKQEGETITLELLNAFVDSLSAEDLTTPTKGNIKRVFSVLSGFEIVSNKIKDLKMYRDWKNGKSICISYNSRSPLTMSFDIGLKVQEGARLYLEGNRNPIMYFFDDASYYSDTVQGGEDNLAVQGIKNIGYNYRSLGLNCVLAVQSLKIIDEKAIDGFNVKIISPLYRNVDGLNAINIPREAIDSLKSGELVKDRDNYILQYLLVDKNDRVQWFFPFTPPCNHFIDTARPRGEA